MLREEDRRTMTEKEQKEMDHIAYVFEKFLYGKHFAREGYKAEGLRVTVGRPDGDAHSDQAAVS